MSHAADPPPAEDHEPAHHTDDEPPGTDSSNGTVVIPAWVSGDWWFAARVAALGHALLLLAGVVIAALHVLRQLSFAGFDGVEWGDALLTPLFVVLGWAGGGAGTPVLLTAVLYLSLAYLLVCRRSPEVGVLVTDRVRPFAAAVKVGVVAAAGLLVVGILVNTVADEALGRAFAPNLGLRIDLTSLVFSSLIVGALAATFAILVAGRSSLTRVLGLSVSVPELLRSGLAGGRRTLAIGGIGLLTLATLGSILDALTQSGTTLGSAIGTLLTAVIDLLLRWLDQALLLLLGASTFLYDGGFAWSAPGARAGWMWLAIPVLVAAYLAGGVVAARHAGPRSRAESARSALLVGPVVAATTLLVALGWAGQPGFGDAVAIAIIVPSLWGAVSLVGAWLWANQQGLPSGLVVERPVRPITEHTVEDEHEAPLPTTDTTAGTPTAEEPHAAESLTPDRHAEITDVVAPPARAPEEHAPRDDAPPEPGSTEHAPMDHDAEEDTHLVVPEPVVHHAAPPEQGAYDLADDDGFVSPPAVRPGSEPTEPLATPSSEDNLFPPTRPIEHDPVSEEDLRRFAPPEPGTRSVPEE